MPDTFTQEVQQTQNEVTQAAQSAGDAATSATNTIERDFMEGVRSTLDGVARELKRMNDRADAEAAKVTEAATHEATLPEARETVNAATPAVQVETPKRRFKKVRRPTGKVVKRYVD